MRFGLFGGATAKPTRETSDSRLYGDFVDYVCEAEALGYHVVFGISLGFLAVALLLLIVAVKEPRTARLQA